MVRVSLAHLLHESLEERKRLVISAATGIDGILLLANGLLLLVSLEGGQLVLSGLLEVEGGNAFKGGVVLQVPRPLGLHSIYDGLVPVCKLFVSLFQVIELPH